jgi:hypothetical protein
MSATSRRLRLGPLFKSETVKLTFACTVVLKAELERYATMHSQAYGESVDAVTLIATMLEIFISRDRDSCERGDCSSRHIAIHDTPASIKRGASNRVAGGALVTSPMSN